MIKIRPKRRGGNDIDSEGSWAISYGDLLTLLLGFFILFFSIDSQKIQEKLLQRSIIATLAAKSHSESKDEKFEKDIQDEKVFDYLGTEIKTAGRRVIIRFPGTSFFDTAQTKLTKSGERKLTEFAKKFVPFAGKSIINVVGFTDDRPVTGPSWQFQDNLELSVLRAVSAQRQLKVAGIPMNRTRIGGHGVKEFIEKNENIDEKLVRAESRTIMLVIEPEYEL